MFFERITIAQRGEETIKFILHLQPFLTKKEENKS
jgi:hypothetical protein